jgi:hypothetical protein
MILFQFLILVRNFKVKPNKGTLNNSNKAWDSLELV